MTSPPEPVACTLSKRGAEAQALEWVDLQRVALRSVPLDTGAQMTFPAEHAARIVDLAERETQCCAFLDIITMVDGDEFILSITSENPDAIGVIAALSGTAVV